MTTVTELAEKSEKVVKINELLTTRNKLLQELLSNVTQYLEGFVMAAGEDNPDLTSLDGYKQALKCCAEIKVTLVKLEAKGSTQQ